MAWPSVYTYNFCSNPSFEANLAGVTSLNGAVIAQDGGLALNGAYSLSVSTPGVQSGEGVILAPGTVLATSAGAVSFYLQASTPTSNGTLSVLVIDTTSSTTLGSATVTFTQYQSWQQVVVTGLALVNAHNIVVYVQTTTPELTAFNIDSVQYEPQTSVNGGALPTPYIDGDQPFASWIGITGNSASSKPFQFQIGGSGDIITFGAGSLLDQGAIGHLVFDDPANGATKITGGIDLSGVRLQGLNGTFHSGFGLVTFPGISTLLMLAGLDDFGLWQSGDPDPAETLIGWNNAGIATGTNTGGNAGYTRPFATFSAPRAFQGSTGKNVWNNAAFFAVGYQVASELASGAQNVTHVQAELVPNNGSAPVPSGYQRPRALTAILAPAAMNYMTNPVALASAYGTTGWTAIGSSALSDVAVGGYGEALQVTGTAANYLGGWIVVPNLIVGEVYTFSAAVRPVTTQIHDIQVVVSPGPSGASLILEGIAGGSAATVALPVGAFTRAEVQFTATASTMNVAVWGIPVTGGVGTMTYYVSEVMLSPGSFTTYGDGNTPGWAWEGTAGLSRSYFYERGNIAYASVQDVLAHHVPLGQHAYAPVYFQPVTQYS